LLIGKRFSAFNSFKCPLSTKYKTIYINDYTDSISLTRNATYFIVRKGFNFYRNVKFQEVIDNYVNNMFSCVSFPVAGLSDNEFAIIWRSDKNKDTNMCNLLSSVEFHDERLLGQNKEKLSLCNVYNIYKSYGINNMYHMYEHLSKIDSSYYDILVKFVRGVNIINNQKCNPDKFFRILSFWGGLNDYNFDVNEIKKFIKNNNQLFTQKNVLLLSKSIIKYGGNQKTAIQLYNELIEEGYNVKLGCVTAMDLVNCIDKNDIIKFDNVNDIVIEANKGNYEYVIANKLDQFVELAQNIKCQCMFVTHNSMDPINKSLIENSKHFDKIFTINHYHTSLLYDNNACSTVTRYLNYDDNVRTKIASRASLKNNIVFIGRISNEKNVNLLLEAFELFNKTFKKVTLTIIGDGKLDINHSEYKNVNFVGRCNYDEIIYHLVHSDYLVSTSCTEGMPFVFLEAMSIGIPVISSNILGCNEIIEENKTGFLFDFENYNKNKNSMDNWDIFDIVTKDNKKNILNITNILKKAYTIDINKWNQLSNNCYKFYKYNFNESNMFKINMSNILKTNKLAIVCNDCDILFKNLFSNIDIREKLSEECVNNYDIIVNVDSFDIFCGKLSLLRNNGFKDRNLRAMNKTISRLYKLHKEMKDNKIKTLSDNTNSISIKFDGCKKIINDIQSFI